jgi:hypothetical protein
MPKKLKNTTHATERSHEPSTTHTKKRSAMSKPKNASKSNHTSSTHHTTKESDPMPTKAKVEAVHHLVASSASPSPTASPSAAPATASTPATTIVTIALPPAGVTIPTPPANYTPATPGEFRGIVPRKGELTALPQALIDLSSFIGFDQTMGAVAPTQAEVEQALTTGAEWTAMCQATTTWLGYAFLMQGLAWRLIRTQMDSLRPAYTLAVKRNPKLAEQYGGLAKLLTVLSTSAQAGAAARKANKQAVAEGKAPIHGKVGKQRQRKAEKAAFATANATPAAPSAPVNPGAAAAAPQLQAPAAPPVQAAAAAPAAATNGVSHS